MPKQTPKNSPYLLIVSFFSSKYSSAWVLTYFKYLNSKKCKLNENILYKKNTLNNFTPHPTIYKSTPPKESLNNSPYASSYYIFPTIPSYQLFLSFMKQITFVLLEERIVGFLSFFQVFTYFQAVQAYFIFKDFKILEFIMFLLLLGLLLIIL